MSQTIIDPILTPNTEEAIQMADWIGCREGIGFLSVPQVFLAQFWSTEVLSVDGINRAKEPVRT